MAAAGEPTRTTPCAPACSTCSTGVAAPGPAALAALGDAREEIDALNVYPVPDGDTGTNLYLTSRPPPTPCATPAAGRRRCATALDGVRAGPLLGARGNSGVILSPARCAGCADALAERDGERPAAALAARLRAATEAAYAAVGHPVEGTILSRRAGRGRGRRGVAGRGDRPRRRHGRAGRPGRRSSARPNSSRCSATPGWSTPAAVVCAWCSTPRRRPSPARAAAPRATAAPARADRSRSTAAPTDDLSRRARRTR